MTCWVEVGDRFEWQEDHKNARIGDSVLIRTIRVDEDATAWVDILEERPGRTDDTDKIAASDIQEKVNEGLLKKI